MTRDRRHVREAREALLRDIGVPEPRPFVPDEFQLRAISSLAEGNDTLVIAPTGAGKTYIAVEAISRIVQQGRRAVYTAPLKALSNAKYAEFKQRFEPGHRVGLLTGDRKIEGDANVVVATTEIYRNELYSLRETYSLVVLDEFHYLSDAQRGPVWEESVILSPSSATLLMLSASISNAEEIADWIKEIRHRPLTIVRITERPVALRLGFLHPDLGVVPLEHENRLLPEVAQFYSGEGQRRGNFRMNRRRGGGGGGRRRR